MADASAFLLIAGSLRYGLIFSPLAEASGAQAGGVGGGLRGIRGGGLSLPHLHLHTLDQAQMHRELESYCKACSNSAGGGLLRT